MNILLWTIYGIGVVAFPIVVGMVAGDGKRWDVFDDGIPLFMLSFMWPAVLPLVMAFAIIAFGAIMIGKLWLYLPALGGLLGKGLAMGRKGECNNV